MERMMRAIDLFAGWGAFTLGATKAGVDVVWAADHWKLAVEAHRQNHPDTKHECQDLNQCDFSQVPDYEILLASPACQGHSTASQPKRRSFHDDLRATAWAVISCADRTNPEIVIVENVPSFKRWKQYSAWVGALELLGYCVHEVQSTASGHGVPQRRKRLFIVATRSGTPPRLEPGPEPAFGPCVQWGEGEWRPVSEATPNVRRRVDVARARHGDRFLTQHVTGHKGVGLYEPIRTITTADQWAVVDRDMYRPLTVRESARAMGFPDLYSWPPGATRTDTIRGIGNAVCPPQGAAIIEAAVI